MRVESGCCISFLFLFLFRWMGLLHQHPARMAICHTNKTRGKYTYFHLHQWHCVWDNGIWYVVMLHRRNGNSNVRVLLKWSSDFYFQAEVVGWFISWKATCHMLCILFFFPTFFEMVIKININPRATFVYKQCPYWNPAGSWKQKKAFNELTALNPWGLPHTHTHTHRGRENGSKGEREWDYSSNLGVGLGYQGQTALNHPQLLQYSLHSHSLIHFCPSLGNTLPLFNLTRAYDSTAHTSFRPL